MRYVILLAVLLLVVVCPASGARSMTGTWTDEARAGRAIPYRIYLPEPAAQPCPIVIFSHGLGGSRDGYRYLGEQFASHGYVSVHLQHPGSDVDAVRPAVLAGEKPQAAMRKLALDWRNAVERPRDVSFAIDQLEKADKAGELAGRLDLARIAVAGHSFGAYTAMAIAGQGNLASFRDRRVSAAIALSPPPPRGAADYARIDIPVLVMTGTLDDSPLLESTAAERIAAFDQLALADRYLLVFTGGDHMVFSGRREAFAAMKLPGTRGDRAHDAAIQGEVARVSLMFLDAYIRDDAGARQWLGRDAEKELSRLGTWKAVISRSEIKP